MIKNKKIKSGILTTGLVILTIISIITMYKLGYSIGIIMIPTVIFILAGIFINYTIFNE